VSLESHHLKHESTTRTAFSSGLDRLLLVVLDDRSNELEEFPQIRGLGGGLVGDKDWIGGIVFSRHSRTSEDRDLQSTFRGRL
jgi:hypothetical protein